MPVAVISCCRTYPSSLYLNFVIAALGGKTYFVQVHKPSQQLNTVHTMYIENNLKYAAKGYVWLVQDWNLTWQCCFQSIGLTTQQVQPGEVKYAGVT